MSEYEFALFQSPVGRCAIVWSAFGVSGLQLPEGRESATRSRLLGRFPGAREVPPPAVIEHAIAEIEALLAGKPSDLARIELDHPDKTPAKPL